MGTHRLGEGEGFDAVGGCVLGTSFELVAVEQDPVPMNL